MSESLKKGELTRVVYEGLREQGYAGPGRPLAPGAGGFWYVTMDEDGATVLVTGVRVEGLSLPYRPSNA